MAKQTYCDGCGKEMPPQVSVLAAAALLNGGNVQIASRDPGGSIDLCETCVCKAFAQKLSRAELTALTPPTPWVPVDENDRGAVLRAGDPPHIDGSTKRVSRDATDAMIVAGGKAIKDGAYVKQVWRAMFDAA